MKKLNLHKVISLLLFLGAFTFVIMAFYWSIEQPSHRPIKAIEVGDLVKTPEGEYVIEYYMDRTGNPILDGFVDGEGEYILNPSIDYRDIKTSEKTFDAFLEMYYNLYGSDLPIDKIDSTLNEHFYVNWNTNILYQKN